MAGQKKWYNSEFFSKIGTGLGIAALAIGIGYGVKGCEEAHNIVELEEIRTRKIQKQFAHLNKNRILDEFYIINGEIAVTKLDGKRVVNPSLSESLDGVLEE